MNLNLLDEESIQPSEPTPCDFFKGENAIKKAKQLGLPDLELVRNAIMIGDADYRTNTHYNRARFIARWGKLENRLLYCFDNLILLGYSTMTASQELRIQ
jgi:hypothetical protein